MKPIHLLSALVITAALAACGQQELDDDPEKVSEKNVFHDQVEALDKAKDATKEIDKAFTEQQQRIDEER